MVSQHCDCDHIADEENEAEDCMRLHAMMRVTVAVTVNTIAVALSLKRHWKCD